MKEPKMDPMPSLSIEHQAPFASLQWKGTDVCMDVHCSCGEHLHFDGSFCYHIKCGNCGQVYECDPTIKLHPLAFEPEGTQEIEKEPSLEESLSAIDPKLRVY